MAMNLACGQEKLLQFSKAVQERMAATLTVSRAPGLSRSSDVSDDSNAAASTPSGGYWPMMRRTVTGRPLAASSLRPDRSAARKRMSGLGCSAAMSTERRAPATRSCTGSTRASEWPKQTLRRRPAPAVAAQIVPQVPPPGQSASLLQDGSMTSRSQFLQSNG